MEAFSETKPSGREHRQSTRGFSRMSKRLQWKAVPILFVLAFLSGQQLGSLLGVTSLVHHSRLSTTSRAQERLLWATTKNEWIQTAMEAAAEESRNPTSPCNVRTRFFLVNTKHPGNVGSSARSIKTMGFFPEGLVVVDPHDKRVLGRKKCIDASSGAKDVLEQSLLVVGNDENENNKNEKRCLEEALRRAFPDGDVLVCGTGMPVDMSHSRASRVYLEPRKFLESLVKEYRNNPQNRSNQTCLNIAFVFGNERYGMNQEDMDLCDVVLGIPTHPSFGSLNLATAVQIVAYDWRQALGGYYEDVS